ncbi:hypothetical protein H0W26_03315, partial [Candidatus Dependentiae bacterium]|nr:hypothetical protein [Candidatus Dependentiae bacterium]
TSSLFNHNDESLLLITAWGQQDTPLSDAESWKSRKKHVEEVASLYGHDTSFIKSNYSEFLNWPVVNFLSPELPAWRIYAVDGIGWAGLVAPIFFAKNCSALYIASANSWYYSYIDCINPFVDNSIRFGNYRVLHDQFECTRLDKALFIARACEKKGFKKPHIKVCQFTSTFGDINCCACKKCLLTMLELCAAGANHREYGFNVSLATAVKRSMHLLRRPIDYEPLWHFMDIQLTIKRNIKKYSRSTIAKLTPFLKRNLLKVQIRNTEQIVKSKVDWNDFSKIVPSVVIPSDLLDEKWEVERRASAALNRPWSL